MKYFANINTAEELKKEFRVLSIKLHPDRNQGNDSEFKAMLSEYETALKNLGAWTKKEADHVAGLRRGTAVIFYGYAMNATYYAVERIEGERVHLVQVGRPCEGVEFFELDETADEVQSTIDDCETTKGGKYDHIRPVSEKFGIGWYWDDIDGKTYTEEEITAARRRADNIKKYGATAKAQREEAARKAKEEREAAEMIVINKWRKELKTIPADATDTKRKAIFKANIKAVFNHYFPGVKVTVSDFCKHYGWGKSGITWTDGPTVDEVEAVEELRYFIASYSTVDETDYHETHKMQSWEQWRDLFGVASGERYEFTRTLSESQKARITEALEAMGAEWEGRDAEGKITHKTGTALLSWEHIGAFMDALGNEGKLKEKVHSHFIRRGEVAQYNPYIARVYASNLEDIARNYMKVSKEAQQAQAEKDNAPRFTPKHGETYRAIVKALGGNKFVCLTDGKEWNQLTALDPIEAAEALARGERVGLGKPWEYDGEPQISGVDAGGEMTHAKRRAKFAKVGFTSPYIRQYHDVYFTEVSAETLEALRQDAADVEKQRKAWEEAQIAPKAEKKTATASATPAEGETLAERDGLALVAMGEGVAIVETENRATYRNRKEIRANGGDWNRDAKQWQAVNPDDVRRLRAWFGLDEEPTNDSNEPQSEPTATADTLHDAEEISETAEAVDAEPTAEDAEEVPTMSAEDLEALRQLKEENERKEKQTAEAVARVALAFVDLCQMLADVAKVQQEETDRARKTEQEANDRARKTARAQEVQTLREGIATLSAQLATMSDQLRKMSDRLAELTTANENENENPETEAEAPQGATATDDKNNDPAERQRVRDKFQRLAEWAEQLTDQNEHTKALRTLCSGLIDRYGNTTLQAAELDTELENIDKVANKRGHITPEERNRRDEIQAELIRLTVEEYGEYLAGILWGVGTVDYYTKKAA